MTVEYVVIDVGAPRDSISLRTLVETMKHHQVAIKDALTGQKYSLAFKEVEDGGGQR